MSGFKSDAQRKHFFANHGGGSGGGGGVPSFPDVTAMTAQFNAGLEASGLSERDKQHEREYFAFQLERLRRGDVD